MSDSMEFVVTGKGVLKEYNGTDEVMVIPDGVKTIGTEILGGGKGEQVRKVVVPEGVTEIKERAFDTSKIAEIILPSTLKTIGTNAFGICENLKSITIPEGIAVIPDSCFWMSGIEEVVLPESIEKIDNRAFMHCKKLHAINLPHLDTLEIGDQAFTGCESMVDENGLFILKNRVFAFYKEGNDRKKAIIPDGIEAIEGDAFEQFEIFDIEMPLACPAWPTYGTAKRNGFATSIINRNGSTISFRDIDGKIVAKIVLATKEETEPKENGFILSIKCSEAGRFDFAGYDSNFALISKAPNKINMALARLQYPYELSEEMQNVYTAFLGKQGNAAGTMLIDADDIDMLTLLGEKKVFNAATTKKLIDYAKSKNKVAITAWLLEYNNNTFGKSAAKPKAAVSAPKTAPVKTNSQPEKSAAEWRKIFKFKYKDGGVIITGYTGTDECVTIPEKIGDKYVIGLGRGAFTRMGYEGSLNTTIKKIVVPGTVTTIESASFYIVKNLEIEIQEGIKELPEWAIDVVGNVTVTLPASLVNIGEQFGVSDEKTIKMVVPENSCAEEFCKKYKLSYTTYVPVASPQDNKAEAIQEQLATAKKQAASKKAVTPWKKPKAGAHLVPRYMGQETVVEFPLEVDGIAITGIANTAGDTPDNYKVITAVVLPEGYTYIGNKAFSGCENLETISLPSTLREIGTQAFAGCKKLKEIILHKEVAFVGKNVFSGSNINVVVLETEKKTKIPSHLFFGCHINNLVVYGGPFKSSGNVFDYTGAVVGTGYAENMYDGNFPENIYMNDDFSTLDLKGTGGGNVKRIHPLADFDETMLLDAAIKDIIAEQKKKKGKVVDNSGKVAEPVTVENIDFENSTFALSGFDNDEGWSINSEITQRGGTIKYEVSSTINYLVIPDRDVVKNSKIKKAMEFQAEGKPIAIIRLAECRRHLLIHDEKMFGTEGAKIASEYRLSVQDEKVTLLTYIGSNENEVIPDTVGQYPVIALGKSCFAEGYRSAHKCKIKSVVVPKGITVLPENVFEYCDELKQVELSEGLMTIEKYAFRECKKLKTVVLPDTLTTIMEASFQRCSALKYMTIPVGVRSLVSPFCGCDALTKINVEAANETYDSRDNCNGVVETATNTLVAGCKATVIPASVTVIGGSAFAGLDSIEEIDIPEGVVEIGDCAFNGCMKLNAITLPDSLKKIGCYAFYFCRELKKVELPNVETIHVSTFGNCDNLTELVVGDSLQVIQWMQKK